MKAAYVGKASLLILLRIVPVKVESGVLAVHEEKYTAATGAVNVCFHVTFKNKKSELMLMRRATASV